MSQPKLSYWQMWNVSFGFLGVQFGFALQNANVSRILSDLGADLHSLSIYWLVAPIMGLLIQPIVGALSDKTWNKLGRRNPFLLAGAAAAALAMFLMPNAPLIVTIVAPLVFAAVMLALMDASFNIAFQPFRALVSDMVPKEQSNKGYSIQSLLINIGAVCGSILPFVLTNVVGLENTAKIGDIAPSVTWAFYIGASVLLGSVLWTVFKTKEYPPQQYYAYKGIDADAVAKEQAQEKSFGQKIKGMLSLISDSPSIMKQLAVVQFFSWFTMFIMWVYTPSAIAQNIWGVDAKWFDSTFLATVDTVPQHIIAAKGAAGDWVGIISAVYFLAAALFSIVLTKLADRLGRKMVYSMSLLAGGIGFLSFVLFQDPELTHVNLLVTEFDIPKGALGLMLPMVGVGIAWAAMLAIPYSILAGALPADKTGTYMGIFNLTIAAPQIVSGLVSGYILHAVFDNHAIYIIMMAGCSMILGAISVSLIKDPAIQSVEHSNDSSVTA